MASDVDFGPLGMPPVAAGGGGAGGGVGAGGGSTATGVAGEGTGGAGDGTAAVAFGREAAPSATPAPSRFRASTSCRQVSAAIRWWSLCSVTWRSVSSRLPIRDIAAPITTASATTSATSAATMKRLLPPPPTGRTPVALTLPVAMPVAAGGCRFFIPS